MKINFNFFLTCLTHQISFILKSSNNNNFCNALSLKLALNCDNKVVRTQNIKSKNLLQDQNCYTTVILKHIILIKNFNSGINEKEEI